MSIPRTIALSGVMGVGKSHLARQLAARLDTMAVDLDKRIEAAIGTTIAKFWQSEGEVAFRRVEAQALAAVLDGPPVVLSLGGGTVVDRVSRLRLAESTTLVTLTAETSFILDRLSSAGIAKRPLLQGDSFATLSKLKSQRRDVYAEAHATMQMDTCTREDAISQIIAVARRNPILVPLGQRSYVVDVAAGSRALADFSRGMVVSDEVIWPFVSPYFPQVSPLLLEPGERNKTLKSVEKIWNGALERGLDRTGRLIALGGGVVGDMVGFAAATLFRGMSFVQMPTTLLAMVDASVGGKTAIDHPLGKNLIGAFHQPRHVIADLDMLTTLPTRHLVSGLAEVVKIALTHDVALLEQVESHAEDLAAGRHELLEPVIRRAIALKVKVVVEDERDENDQRAILNFGHTVGHALESEALEVGDDVLLHGEAVGLGMIAALRVGIALGETEPSLLTRTVNLLDRLGLPTSLDTSVLVKALPRIAHDKKREGVNVHTLAPRVAYVLCKTPGVAIVRRLDLPVIVAALTS